MSASCHIADQPHMADHKARILIVDDECDNRELLGIILTHEGFLVSDAGSGREALDAVARQPPDLILLDIMMPGMTGYEVTTSIKGNESTKHIPIIMVTALADQNTRMLAQSAGADGFLTKPTEIAELCAHVRNLLRRTIDIDACSCACKT